MLLVNIFMFLFSNLSTESFLFAIKRFFLRNVSKVLFFIWLVNFVVWLLRRIFLEISIYFLFSGSLPKMKMFFKFILDLIS